MATTGHVWRATRLNTRRNSTRHSVSAVLRNEKLRAAALTAASFGVSPAHDFVGAGAAPRSQRVVAFNDAVTVHYLPPLNSFDDESDPEAGEEGICETCHAPVEEERRKWKLALGLGFVRQVDELDGVRGVCRCRKRYPEYGMEGDEVIVEEEVDHQDHMQILDEDDDDDVFSNFAKASRTLFPKPNYLEKKFRADEDNLQRDSNNYALYDEVADDDDYSTEPDSIGDRLNSPPVIIPPPSSAADARMLRPTRSRFIPRPSSNSTGPLISDNDEDQFPPPPPNDHLDLPPSSDTRSVRRPVRSETKRPMSDPIATAQRRARTLPPPCRRPAQRLSGSDALPQPPVRTSSMSESIETPDLPTPAPMSGGEEALARIAAAAMRTDKHLSQLTPSQGSPGEAASARARDDGGDFSLPPAATGGLPGPTRPREGSSCSQRSQRSTTRVLSMLAAEQALQAPPSPEIGVPAAPTRWLPRSNRNSGLSAATAPGDIMPGAEDGPPGRLRFRGRRARAAELAGDRPLPPSTSTDDSLPPRPQPVDQRARLRRPDAAPRERSFAGFNRETSLVSATGFEERREEFGPSARPYMPRISKTDLGHLGHISPVVAERRAHMLARDTAAPARGKMASLRGLRVKMSRMMRSAKGGVPAPQGPRVDSELKNMEPTGRSAAAADSPKKGSNILEKSSAKPPREKVQKQLRLVVEKNDKSLAAAKKSSVQPTREKSAKDKIPKEKVQKQLRLVVERNQRTNKQTRTDKLLKDKTGDHRIADVVSSDEKEA